MSKLVKTAIMAASILAMATIVAATAYAGGGLVRHGGNGPDTITGTKYNDKLYGEKGPDTLRGRAGRDLLVGGKGGGDVCIGGRGKDRFRGCEEARP